MKIERIKQKSIFFIRYFGDALFYPFFYLYLINFGYKDSTIGWILMIFPLTAIFINPIWGLLSKNPNSNKKIAILLCGLEAISIMILVLVGANPIFIVILTFLISILGQPTYILLDGYALAFSKEEEIEYSSIRVFASLGYALAALVAGILAEKFGFQVPFLLAAFLFSIAGMILVLKKDIKFNKDVSSKQKYDLKELFKNKRFWFLIIQLFLFIQTMYSIENYIPKFYKLAIGINDQQYGFLIFGIVILEVIFLFFMPKIAKKIKTDKLVLIATLLLVLRIIIYIFSKDKVLLILVSLLRAPIMAVFLYGFYKLFEEIVKPYNITMSIFIFNISSNIYRVFLTVIFGYIIINDDYKYVFISGICFLTISLILYFVQKLIFKDKKIKEIKE